MTSNFSIPGLMPDQGSSPGLRRWLDFLRDSGASQAGRAQDAGASRSRAVTGPDGPSGALRAHLPTPATSLATAAGATIAASRATAAGVEGGTRAHPSLDSGALEAHAALGELEVRRATYGSLERIFSRSGSAGSAASATETLEESARRRRDRHRDERVQATQAAEAMRQARAAQQVFGQERDDSAAGATSAPHVASAPGVAGARVVPPGDVVAAAAGDAARELARTSDRLETLRMEAGAAIRATAARVDALAQEVASADRRARMQERREAAVAAADDAAQTQGRRDAAARELVRLTGAQVDVRDDGTLDIRLGGRPLVDGQGAHALRVAGEGEAPDGAGGAEPEAEGAGRARSPQPHAAPAPGEDRGPDRWPGQTAREPESTPPPEFDAVALATRDALARIGAAPTAPEAAAPSRRAQRDAAGAADPAERGDPVEPADRAGRLRWAEGGAVTGVSGVLAGQLASAQRLVPMAADGLRDVQERFVASVRALAAPGAPLEGQDVEALLHPLTAAAAPGAPAGGAAPPPGPVPATASAGARAPADSQATADADPDLVDVALDTLAGLPAALAGLRDSAADRLQGAQRRLDVLSVVDAVLAGGAPPADAGGLVSAAIGAAAPSAGTQAAQSSQHLVSSLQAVNALTASLGTVAGLAAAVGPTPPIVSVSGSPQLVATPAGAVLGLTGVPSDPGSSASPSASSSVSSVATPAGFGPVVGSLGPALPQEHGRETAGPWQPGAGVQVRMFSAPGAPGDLALGADPATGDEAGSRTAGPVPGWAGPGIPFEADVTIHSVAASASVATATLPVGGVLNSGRGFSFALLTHADSASPQVTSVTVGEGARLRQVAGAINASGAPALARVEGLSTPTGPGQRLVVTASDSGADTRLALVDGLGTTRPSVLGATVTLRSGADSVVDVAWADGAAVRITAPSSSLPGALPGVDLALRGGADGPATARLEVGADAPAAWRRLETLGTGAAAVLDGLAGRSAIDAAAGRALAADPAIATLSSRIAAALGLAGDETAPGGAAPAAAGATPGSLAAARQSLPGLRLERDGRVLLDREAFLRAYDKDPGGLEARVQSAARELLSVARETTDPRSGVLPVRIMGEQAFVSEYSVGSAGVDERMQYRQDALEERTEAMQSLLVRLGQEQQWLGEQVS